VENVDSGTLNWLETLSESQRTLQSHWGVSGGPKWSFVDLIKTTISVNDALGCFLSRPRGGPYEGFGY
jgi:hypothetical protein